MKRDPGLFRALGYLSARGSITEYHRRDRNTTVRRVRVAVDPEALERLRRDLSALNIAHQTEPRALKIDSQTVADGLLRLGLPLGPRRETGPKVPDAVHRAPTHLKAAYLSGLFDARASIADDSPTTPRVTLTATTPARHRDRLTAFLRDVRTLLHDLRIPATPTQPSGRDYLRAHLHVDGDTHVHRLLTRVGFPYHERKRREAHRLSTRLERRIERLRARARPADAPPEPVLHDPGLPERQEAYLRRRGLLPLDLDDHKTPLLARVLGYALGDGSLHEIDGRPRLTLAGEPEGLRDLADDLTALGVGTGLRRWDTKDMVELHVHSRAFARYLERLGMPRSPKVERAYRVPRWIRRAPTGIKAEFLAGLFGADGWLTESNGRYTVGLTLAKSLGLSGSLEGFMDDVVRLLSDLGMSREKVRRYWRDPYETERGGTRVKLSLRIHDRRQVERFLRSVGFAYSRRKSRRARSALRRLAGA